MVKHLNIPISKDEIINLEVGEPVLLSGIMVTGRDTAHKWLHDTFISKITPATKDDVETLNQLKPYLDGGVIYHCGPVVSGLDTNAYKFVAAGPTTSMREESVQADVIKLMNLRGVIGKGGMGPRTLKGLHESQAVYFHAIGGAALVIAETVTEVIGVYKLGFGVPEAFWVIKVKNFPVTVTMDAHENSLHSALRSQSKTILDRLID